MSHDNTVCTGEWKELDAYTNEEQVLECDLREGCKRFQIGRQYKDQPLSRMSPPKSITEGMVGAMCEFQLPWRKPTIIAQSPLLNDDEVYGDFLL